MKTKIVVTIPAYNEEETLGKVIGDINLVMSKARHNYLIHVVDDGSTDKTSEIAKAAGAIVTRHPYNCGLAEAFKTEIKRCLELGANIIVHTDADGQYAAEDIPRFLTEIQNGHDLVLGSRFLGKIEHMPIIKRIGNIAFSKAISHI